MKGKKRNKRRSRKIRGRGNSAPLSVADPFPKIGLVAEYRGFILGVVTRFCRQYPEALLRDVLHEAIRIAVAVEPRFRPELGYDFSTFLGAHLKELHRYIGREHKHTRVPIYEDKKAKAHREAEEAGEPVRLINFGPRLQVVGSDYAAVGNGTRLSFDFQWTTPSMGRALTTYRSTGEFIPVQRHRIVLGTQLLARDEGHTLEWRNVYLRTFQSYWTISR